MAIEKISKEKALEVIMDYLADCPSAPNDGPPVSLPPKVIKRLHAGHRRGIAFLAKSMERGGYKVIK